MKVDISINFYFLNNALGSNNSSVTNIVNSNKTGLVHNINTFVNLLYCYPSSEAFISFFSNELEKTRQHSQLVNIFKNSLEENFGKNVVTFSNKKKVKGIVFKIKGRINGIDRKKEIVICIGSMPKQTVSKNVKYSFGFSKTPFGICSSKLWVYWDKSLLI